MHEGWHQIKTKILLFDVQPSCWLKLNFDSCTMILQYKKLLIMNYFNKCFAVTP